MLSKSKPWVAEVWLDWEICRGSTMYRDRFRWKWQACVWAKIQAVLMDKLLVTHYPAEDSSGNWYLEKYTFEIKFGVRKATKHPRDLDRFVSYEMPGHLGHCGEHANAHPLENLDDIKEEA